MLHLLPVTLCTVNVSNHKAKYALLESLQSLPVTNRNSITKYQIPVIDGSSVVAEVTNVTFVDGVKLMVVILSVDVDAVSDIFVVDIDVTFNVVVFAIYNSAVGTVAFVGGVAVIDEVVLGSAFVVVYRVLIIAESVAVLKLAAVVLAGTAVATDGVVIVNSVVALSEAVDFNDDSGDGVVSEPDVTVLSPANQTKS